MAILPLLCIKLTKFPQLTLTKITKFVATRCHILRRKSTKFDFGWGSGPDPAGGAYSAPPDLLAGGEGGVACPLPKKPAPALGPAVRASILAPSALGVPVLLYLQFEPCASNFSSFRPLAGDDIAKAVRMLPDKQCTSDPSPLVYLSRLLMSLIEPFLILVELFDNQCCLYSRQHVCLRRQTWFVFKAALA